MQLPKVSFKFSSIYNEHFRDYIEQKFPQFLSEYPYDDFIVNYIGEVSHAWSKVKDEVLSEMHVATNLKWEKKKIDCYIVGNCIPFSEPLTIKVYKKTDRFIDSLTHELIHQFFTQESHHDKMVDVYKKIDKRWSSEAEKTKIHILVHALHKHIYLKIFNESRLDRDIEISSQNKEYKKAWEIVNQEGYDKILKLF